MLSNNGRPQLDSDTGKLDLLIAEIEKKPIRVVMSTLNTNGGHASPVTQILGGVDPIRTHGAVLSDRATADTDLREYSGIEQISIISTEFTAQQPKDPMGAIFAGVESRLSNDIQLSRSPEGSFNSAIISESPRDTSYRKISSDRQRKWEMNIKVCPGA